MQLSVACNLIPAGLFWQISAIFAFAPWSLSFWWSFDQRTLKEVVTVANVLNGCYTWVETEPKWFYYFDYTNVANEDCVKFCRERVFKCRRKDDVMRSRMDKSSSLGMPMSPQDTFKKYKCQSLEMPKASPSSSTKHQVIPPDAIFLSLHILCVVLGASVVFVFSLV